MSKDLPLIIENLDEPQELNWYLIIQRVSTSSSKIRNFYQKFLASDNPEKNYALYGQIVPLIEELLNTQNSQENNLSFYDNFSNQLKKYFTKSDDKFSLLKWFKNWELEELYFALTWKKFKKSLVQVDTNLHIESLVKLDPELINRLNEVKDEKIKNIIVDICKNWNPNSAIIFEDICMIWTEWYSSVMIHSVTDRNTFLTDYQINLEEAKLIYWVLSWKKL